MKNGFCRGPLWDSNLTWHTADPDLTVCMRDTVLVGLPCAVLWLSGPIWLVISAKNGPGQFGLRHGKLFWAKFVLCLLLFCSSVQELSNRFEDLNDDMHPSDVFGPVCLMVTSLLSVAMTLLEKNWKIIRSSPQFTFWLLITISSLPTFKVQIQAKEEKVLTDEYANLFVIVTSTPVMFLLLILNCFSDLDDTDHTILAPEDSASVPSQAYFCWLDSLVWRSYRHSLSQGTLPKTALSLNVGHCSIVLNKVWRSLAFRAKVDFTESDPGKRKSLSLLAVMVKIHWPQMLLVWVLSLIHI